MTTSAFDIFSRVIDLEPEDRTTALTDACGEDAVLRDEVESLLRAHDTADASFLNGPALNGAARECMASASVRDHAGKTIGPYRLVREIGTGGMGSVWLAERADGEFEQRVAIKLIHRGMDSAEILHRFRRERQVLAGLTHPNIARLLDGGTTDDGLPYLVMEYVEGERIDSWCDAKRKTIDERIRLFLKVCAAVQDAHRNLVVHRDLKPGNLLVNTEGAPKLLDFGIAGLLANETQSLDVTMTHDRRMTPAYASPEQVRGGPITTATDVYSLGVILYELLSGRRPYDIASATAAETERAICETTPTRPSVAVTTTASKSSSLPREAASGEEIARRRSTDLRALQRRLSGDLEKIMLMALRKEPERRYSSVEAFAEDLRRCLVGLPVTAQHDTVGYRVRRFVGRHRVGTSVAGIVVLGFTTAVITILALFFQARIASNLAEDEALAANTVSSYLRDMVDSIDPAIALGRDVTLFREMLDGLATRLEREAVGPARVRAELHQVVGSAYHAIGEYENAEYHLTRAVALRREDNGDPLLLADALIALSKSQRSRAEYDGSIAAATEALDIQQATLPENDSSLTRAMITVGITRWASGEYDEGERILRDSLAMLRADADRNPGLLATVLRELGALLADRQKPDEAEPLLLESRDLLLELHGPQHPAIALVEARLGWCARRANRLSDSLAHYERALEINEALLAPDHPTIGYNLGGIAAVLEDLDRFDEAEIMYLRALDHDHRALGPHHTELGTVHNNLGGLYRKLGRLDEAVEHLQRAIDVYTAARGAEDLWTSYPWLNLSRVYHESGRLEDAMVAVTTALDIRLKNVSPDHQEVYAVRLQEGLILTALDRFDEAEPILRECIDALGPIRGEDHPSLVDARKALRTASSARQN